MGTLVFPDFVPGICLVLESNNVSAMKKTVSLLASLSHTQIMDLYVVEGDVKEFTKDHIMINCGLISEKNMLAFMGEYPHTTWTSRNKLGSKGWTAEAIAHIQDPEDLIKFRFNVEYE